MSFVSIFLIAIGLGMDAFSVAVGTGFNTKRVDPGQLLRLSTGFGLFQFMMPLLGWTAGRTVADLISRYDHWVAFALLAGVGAKMILDSIRANDNTTGIRPDMPDPTRGFSLIVLSVATSIDAFAVGLSFALLDISVMAASLIIGIVAFAMTAGGIFLGAHAGKKLGRKAGILGGLILIAIGLRILLKDLI